MPHLRHFHGLNLLFAAGLASLKPSQTMTIHGLICKVVSQTLLAQNGITCYNLIFVSHLVVLIQGIFSTLVFTTDQTQDFGDVETGIFIDVQLPNSYQIYQHLHIFLQYDCSSCLSIQVKGHRLLMSKRWLICLKRHMPPDFLDGTSNSLRLYPCCTSQCMRLSTAFILLSFASVLKGHKRKHHQPPDQVNNQISNKFLVPCTSKSLSVIIERANPRFMADCTHRYMVCFRGFSFHYGNDDFGTCNCLSVSNNVM